MGSGSLIQQSKANPTCQMDDYSPCSCERVELDVRNCILCNDKEVEPVMDVFKRTQAIELAELKFIKNQKDDLIPNNFISNKTMGKLILNCSNNPAAKFEKDSFNSTRL